MESASKFQQNETEVAPKKKHVTRYHETVRRKKIASRRTWA
jgi:hypothetical protein